MTSEPEIRDEGPCLPWARELLAVSGTVVELRALDVGGGRVHSGYFDNAADLATAASSLDGRASGIYTTLNPVQPSLLARAQNRLIAGPKATTSDKDIVSRRFLLIDIDPKRPSGISATEQEKKAASKTAGEVVAYLEARGFPPPFKADSGNGAHLLYRVDLPADDGGLVRRFLKSLAFLFDTDEAAIDQTVHNPARISKFYGTLARKGDGTDDRSHRRSRLFSVPENPELIAPDLLEEVVSTGPPEQAGMPATREGSFDVDAFLRSHGLRVLRAGPWQDGRRWVLDVCPFDDSHTDRSAYVVQFGTGALAAGCHHNGCTGKGWHDLREAIDPGWRAPQRTPGTYGSAPLGDSWPEPEPLPTELLPVMEFNPELLPVAFRPWVEDIAARVQCPPDFPAVAILVVLAAVVGRKVGIRPKRKDDWLVVVNLWAVIIGRPGILKTPSVQEPLKVLLHLESLAQEEFEKQVLEYEANKLLWDSKKSKGFSKAIEEGVAQGKNALDVAHEICAEKPVPPTRGRLIANDTTVEKLGVLLSENSNGLLVYRDELMGLFRSLDKDGNEGARAFYLEAWSGTGRFTYDRIGRGTVDIEAAIVSILGGIQPGPLGRYLLDALRHGAGDDGLVQRFQLAVWPDVSKAWVNVDRCPDSEARRNAHAVYLRLASLDPLQIGALVDEGDAEIPFLRFAPEAQDLFDGWRAELERVVRSGVEHPAVESHLAKYRSLVPSLALLFHLADEGEGPVQAASLRRAIGWAEYLETHARRIYAVAVDPSLPAARTLVGKIRSGGLKDGFNCRQVYRKSWAGLSTKAEAEAAIGYLADLNWLREVREKTGGPTKVTYLINPRVLEKPERGTAISDTGSGKEPHACPWAVAQGAKSPAPPDRVTDISDRSAPDASTVTYGSDPVEDSKHTWEEV